MGDHPWNRAADFRKVRVTLLALSLIASAGQRAIGDSSVPHRIRVRIAQAQQILNLRAANVEFSSGQQVRRLAGTQRFQVGCGGGKVYVFADDTQFIFPGWVSFQAPGFLFLGVRPYREEFRVHATALGCDLVNVVDVEQYLAGLVNSEFSTKWNAESVAAQVIAARTYAYYQMSAARKNPRLLFDVESTTKDQVYEGSTGEDDVAYRIVNETRGQILGVGDRRLAGGVRPIKAFYHSTCGGRTADPEGVMGDGTQRYARSVPCPFCKSSPAFSWSLELNESEVRKALWAGIQNDGAPLAWPARGLQELRPWFQKGVLLGLSVSGRDGTGRVEDVVLSLALGGLTRTMKVSAVMFRRWLGPSVIKSTAFGLTTRSIDPGSKVSAFRFEGRGNGHGVGMCQWGAKEMGALGYTRVAILKHYYPGAEVRKLW